MTRPVRCLSTENVLRLHARVMELTEWSVSPLRSKGLLESAVNRPWNIAHYEGADLVRQATVLAIGISQNQPFLDGNKRPAYIAMLSFPELYGFTVAAKPLEIARQLEATAHMSSDLKQVSEEFAARPRVRVQPMGSASGS